METLSLLQNKDYRKLWGSEFISEIGNYFSFFGVIFYVIDLTRSQGIIATAQSLIAVVIFQVVPTVFVGPFVGVLVDRFNRKYILIVANFTGFLVTVGYSLSTGLAHIYFLVTIHSLVRLSFYPTRAAILPRLVSKAELLQANSFIQISVQFSRLLGPLLAGIVLYQFGFVTGFLADGLTYLLAIYIVSKIKADLRPHASDQHVSSLKDIGLALKIVSKRPDLKFIFGSFFLLLIAVGILDPLLAPYLNARFGFSALEFGFLLAFSAICGGVAAGILITRKNIHGKLKLISVFYALGGTALILLSEASYNGNLVFLFIGAGLLGIVNVGLYILTATFIQETVNDANLGKINGFFATLLVLGQLFGSLLASWLIQHLLVEVIFTVIGGTVAIMGVFSLMSVKHYHWEMEVSSPVIHTGKAVMGK